MSFKNFIVSCWWFPPVESNLIIVKFWQVRKKCIPLVSIYYLKTKDFKGNKVLFWKCAWEKNGAEIITQRV